MNKKIKFGNSKNEWGNQVYEFTSRIYKNVYSNLAPICSYCGGNLEMQIRKVRIEPPTGARDMEIYKERFLEVCLKCDFRQEFKQGFKPDQCRCGAYLGAYSSGSIGRARKVSDWQCTDCAPCHHCQQPLRTWDFMIAEASWVNTRHSSDSEDWDENRAKFLFHPHCAGENCRIATLVIEAWDEKEEQKIAEREGKTQSEREDREEKIRQEKQGQSEKNAVTWQAEGRCVSCGANLKTSFWENISHPRMKCKQCGGSKQRYSHTPFGGKP